ncbi:hypothetical protein Y032_0038g3538 [Ancylostoma ceylanicum]|nr:hypothetical protein Y032_0038g3538 [Ancylostoma ceylanicum]
MRAFMLTEPEEDELDYPGESETVEEQTTSVTSNRSRVSEPYKYDLQERLKETLERMRSTSFDNDGDFYFVIDPVVYSHSMTTERGGSARARFPLKMFFDSNAEWPCCLTNVFVTAIPTFDHVDHARLHAVTFSAKWANYAVGRCARTIVYAVPNQLAFKVVWWYFYSRDQIIQACSPQTEPCSSAYFIGDERHAELDFVFNVGVSLSRLVASSPTMGSFRFITVGYSYSGRYAK